MQRRHFLTAGCLLGAGGLLVPSIAQDLIRADADAVAQRLDGLHNIRLKVDYSPTIAHVRHARCVQNALPTYLYVGSTIDFVADGAVNINGRGLSGKAGDHYKVFLYCEAKSGKARRVKVVRGLNHTEFQAAVAARAGRTS